MSPFDITSVKLIAKNMEMKETLEMTLFIIKDWGLVPRNSSNHQDGIRMIVILKRMIMNEMKTTYLPSVLLILITWATTFFKPYFFEARI